jgi:hypothetical protein
MPATMPATCQIRSSSLQSNSRTRALLPKTWASPFQHAVARQPYAALVAGPFRCNLHPRCAGRGSVTRRASDGFQGDEVQGDGGNGDGGNQDGNGGNDDFDSDDDDAPPRFGGNAWVLFTAAAAALGLFALYQERGKKTGRKSSTTGLPPVYDR